MKKITFYAAFFLIALTSCKKEYTCDCVITTSVTYDDGFSEPVTTTGTTTSTRKITAKKKDAISDCESSNGTKTPSIFESLFGPSQTVTTTCAIK